MRVIDETAVCEKMTFRPEVNESACQIKMAPIYAESKHFTRVFLDTLSTLYLIKKNTHVNIKNDQIYMYISL